jgi:hypothetical protein
MGRTVRSICCAANGSSGSKLNIPASTDTTGKFFFGIFDFMMIVPFSFLSLSQCLVFARLAAVRPARAKVQTILFFMLVSVVVATL